MRVTIDLVSIIRQANLANDGTRKCVVSGSPPHRYDAGLIQPCGAKYVI